MATATSKAGIEQASPPSPPALTWLQRVALVLGFAAVAEFLFISDQRGYSWSWLVPATTYVAAVWALLRRPAKGWQQRSLTRIVQLALGTVPGAAFSVAVLAGVSLWQATLLREDFFDPNYVFQVYRVNGAFPVADAPFELHDLRSPRPPQSGRTGPDGIIRLRVAEKNPYQYRLQVPEAGGRIRTTVQKVANNADRSEPIDIAQIPDNQWLVVDTVRAAPDFGGVRRESVSALTRAVAAPEKQARPRSTDFWPWGEPNAEIVLERPHFLVGFDPQRRIPRWVAYRLQLGTTHRERESGFVRDADLPAEAQASENTYRGQGYDRGHLISRAELSGAEPPPVLNTYSIVVPQDQRLNRLLWVKVEQFCADTARTAPAWVIAGPAFLARNGSGSVEYLELPGGVAVPTHLFRVIVRRTPDGKLQALGFLVPNEPPALSSSPANFLVPISVIERVTGLSFFGHLPAGERERLLSETTLLWPD